MLDIDYLDFITKYSEELTWRQVPAKAIEIYNHLKPVIDSEWEKCAYSPTLRWLSDALRFTPSGNKAVIGPSPLAAALITGMAGAGLGYGMGALGEALSGRKLKKKTTLLGGLLGATPGIMWAGTNLATDRKLNDPSMLATPDSSLIRDRIKKASFGPDAGLIGIQPIPVDEFNRVIWEDRRVAAKLPLPLRAAASGLVSSAAQLGSTNNQIATPLQMGILASGMMARPSSFHMGALAGQALGTMMNLPKREYETALSTGLMAGVISTVVPRILPFTGML